MNFRRTLFCFPAVKFSKTPLGAPSSPRVGHFSSRVAVKFPRGNRTILLEIHREFPVRCIGVPRPVLLRLICASKQKRRRKIIRDPETRGTTTYSYLALNRVLKASHVNQATRLAVPKAAKRETSRAREEKDENQGRIHRAM